MAKIAIIDDYAVYAEMLAGPLLQRGHSLLIELNPIDFERLMSFQPSVITLGLYRNKCAFDRPIREITQDVTGYQPLAEMESYPAVNVIPIVLIGSGLQEKDVPTLLNYDLFLSFPDEISRYVEQVEELATAVKTRRRISGYLCPDCMSRLVYLKEPVRDLFCPRCHVAVTLIQGEGCFYTRVGETEMRPCDLGDIQPPREVVEAYEQEAPVTTQGELYPDPTAAPTGVSS